MTAKYDPKTGCRLTNCCGAYSTFDEHGTLYCKVCFEPVPFGQGDGSEVRNDNTEETQ